MKKILLYLTFAGLLFSFDLAHAQDAITNMTAPATVTQGEIITVTVDYVADTDPKDLNVTIKPISGTGNYGFTRETVSAGTGSADVSLSIDPSIPVADNAYKIVCYMTPEGGSFDVDWPQLVQNEISAVAAPVVVVYDIPVNNGDVENTTAMFQDASNEDKWSIEGMWFNENADVFDAANSGLAPGEGRNGSQALKSVIHNATGGSADVSLSVGDIDISSHGPGTYTFTFYAKSLTAPNQRPFWIVCNTFDMDNADVTSATVTRIDNGGTVTFNGLEAGYLEQTVTVDISENSGGNNAMYLRLQVQHGKEDNTYWFDDFSLVGPEGTSTAIDDKELEMGVNIFPNPARTKTTINSETAISNVSLYSLSGEMIINETVKSNEYQLDLSSYPKGLYLLSVTNDNGTSTTKLVIN
ncbi:MAG TPA: T9SS type A sorting domain-containing protein [Bacteroidales bacterium]|nr:T9SS type A sorting domain-containing protein [Bacteroidales bacterium]